MSLFQFKHWNSLSIEIVLMQVVHEEEGRRALYKKCVCELLEKMSLTELGAACSGVAIATDSKVGDKLTDGFYGS